MKKLSLFTSAINKRPDPDHVDAERRRDLYMLNKDLAAQMISLASEHNDIGPLKLAVRTLQDANEYYSQDTTPHENVEVRQMIADALLRIGQAQADSEVIDHAIQTYRSAIALASLLSDENLRMELKANYAKARSIQSQLVADRPNLTARNR